MTNLLRMTQDEVIYQKRRICSIWVTIAIALLSLRNTILPESSPMLMSHSTILSNEFLCRAGKNSPWSELSQVEWNNHIKDFFLIWKRSPDRDNVWGCGFFHYFALYVMIRQLKPVAIVESGALKGVGTWMLRQAAGPETKIIVITKERQQRISSYVDAGNSLYLAGKNFVDFSQTTREQWVDWVGGPENLSRTLLFFDDHQAGLKRVLQGKKLGFKHFVFDDNYPPTHGDNFSMKQICPGLRLWNYFGTADVIYKDNFGSEERPISHSEFEDYQRMFRENVAVYAEFPPVWNGPSRFDPTNLTKIERIREPPLFSAKELLHLGLDEAYLPWEKESLRYTFILYAQAYSN